MEETFRHCPECRAERLFEQFHPLPGSCPDAPDGICPEWICSGCGSALLAGFVACRDRAGSAFAPGWRGRVA